MPSGRLKDVLTTLRFRLAAWVTLIVLLVVSIAMIVVWQLVKSTLVEEFDRRLEQDVSEVRLALKQFAADKSQFYALIDRKAAMHVHVGWFVQLFDPQGKHLWSSNSAPPPPKPAEVTRLADKPLSNDDIYRSVVASFEDEDMPALLFRLGSTRRSFEDDVALLNWIMILATVLILILAPVSGYLLAGRATHPIAQIIDTTGRLQPKNLNERLPIRGSGDELDQLSSTINGMLDRIAAYIESNRD